MAFLLSGGKSTEESSDSNAGEAASSGSSDTDDHRTPLEEFNDYLRSSSPGLSANPLDWWNKNSDRFPTVAMVARKLLCVTATSVPSERVFFNSREHCDGKEKLSEAKER